MARPQRRKEKRCRTRRQCEKKNAARPLSSTHLNRRHTPARRALISRRPPRTHTYLCTSPTHSNPSNHAHPPLGPRPAGRPARPRLPGGDRDQKRLPPVRQTQAGRVCGAGMGRKKKRDASGWCGMGYGGWVRARAGGPHARKRRKRGPPAARRKLNRFPFSPQFHQADEEAATHAGRATPGAVSAVVNAAPAKKAKHNVAGVGKVNGKERGEAGGCAWVPGWARKQGGRRVVVRPRASPPPPPPQPCCAWPSPYLRVA